MQFAYHFVSIAKSEVCKKDLSPAALSFSSSSGTGDASSFIAADPLSMWQRRDESILMNYASTEE